MRVKNYEIIKGLNNVMVEEITAVNRYLLYAEECRDWGYMALYNKFMELYQDESNDLQQLIRQVLYLNGSPKNEFNIFSPGNDPVDLLHLSLISENNTINVITDAMMVCHNCCDYQSYNLLETMIVSEHEHYDWFETQLQLVSKLGEPLYLSQMMRE